VPSIVLLTPTPALRAISTACHGIDSSINQPSDAPVAGAGGARQWRSKPERVSQAQVDSVRWLLWLHGLGLLLGGRHPTVGRSGVDLRQDLDDDVELVGVRDAARSFEQHHVVPQSLSNTSLLDILSAKQAVTPTRAMRPQSRCLP